MRAALTFGPVERADDARLMTVDVRTADGDAGFHLWADAGGWSLGDVGDECPALAHLAGTPLGRTARAARTAIRAMVRAAEAEGDDLAPPAEPPAAPTRIPPWLCQHGCNRYAHARPRAAGEGGADFGPCPGAAR